MTPDPDLLNIFWVEVGDYLQSLNRTLLQTEAAAQSDPEALREMNRVAHSMKGAARAVGIQVIETLAHSMEDIFSAALKQKIELTHGVCDLLYDGLDLIQNVVNGTENDPTILASTMERLEEVVAIAESPKPHTPAEKKRTTAMRAVAVGAEENLTIQIPVAEESIRVPVSRMDRLMGEVSELLVMRMHSEERQRDFQQLQKLNRRWQREWRNVRTAYIRLARRLQHESGDVPEEVLMLFKFLETNQRFLMEMNRQLVALSRDMTTYNAQLSMLAEKLQDDIAGMRLVPFETLVSGFQRLVRDLGRDTDKEAHLEVIGSSVEMDKTALDVLKEPIMHLLRNALDHGLETTKERTQKGKPPIGLVRLIVEQRGKDVLIHISDDGRGLNADQISQAAVEAGLVTQQEAAALGTEETYNFIFHPGLTTRREVTTLSGRGLGMDIVRTRVESLRGRVSVDSTPGRGTTITLRIPLSLSRLSCILVSAGKQTFAVPSASVWRMLKLKRDQLFLAEGREMVIVENRPVPVVPMASVLGLPVSQNGDGHEWITLLVLATGERAIAFEVEDLFSEEELVLKPLGREIANAPYVTGGALLGSGEIILVLDPNAVLRGATGQPHIRRIVEVPQDKPTTALSQTRHILIVDDSITTRTLEKHILETAGFVVSVAIDGVEAWERLREIQPDLVISDVEMPRMNGLELTRRIKEDHQFGQLPVILLTSLNKPEQREAGLHAGADAYLIKSRFEQAELLRMIWSLV
jgi:two-component system chemotaxis sensor kinase CheA